MTTYAQHGEFLETVYQGAFAELQGFLHAKQYESAPAYSNPRYQWRYEQGFGYGKHLLREKVSA